MCFSLLKKNGNKNYRQQTSLAQVVVTPIYVLWVETNKLCTMLHLTITPPPISNPLENTQKICEELIHFRASIKNINENLSLSA